MARPHVHRWAVESPEQAQRRIAGGLDTRDGMVGRCKCRQQRVYPFHTQADLGDWVWIAGVLKKRAGISMGDDDEAAPE